MKDKNEKDYTEHIIEPDTQHNNKIVLLLWYIEPSLEPEFELKPGTAHQPMSGFFKRRRSLFL